MTERPAVRSPSAGLDAVRDRAAGSLDRIVREHRFTIAVVFPVVGGFLLVGGAIGRVSPTLAFHPLLLVSGIFVMRSPLLGALLPIVDRRAAVGLGALAGYTYAIEYVGITTAWPYGSFSYGRSLGPMAADIPVALPILFVPLVANAYLLWLLLVSPSRYPRVVRIAAGIVTVLAMDLVLDPAAVELGFWRYVAEGWFHGVPLANFRGWALSATIGLLALEWSFDSETVSRRLDRCRYALDDLVSFLLLWSLVNASFGQWIPVGVGIGMAVLLGIARCRQDR